MANDSVSQKLAGIAQPHVVAAFARYDGLTLDELQRERDACEERFRSWARDPRNRERPLSECPDHMNRIALDSLLERRLFCE